MLPAARTVSSSLIVEAVCLRIARGLGLVACAVGACALLGWTFGLPALTMVLPGLVTMKGNTAICIALGGLSLFYMARRQRGSSQSGLAATFAVVMTFFGALTLLEYLSGRSLGIDEWLFKDPAVSSAPGRMAPITAINSVCVGLALVFLRSPRRIVVAQALAAVAVFTSVLAIVGYVYRVDPLYQSGRFTAVALHTSVSFFLLGGGIWCASSQAGFMRLVTSAGTSGMIVRTCAPAAFVLPFLIGWLRVQGVKYGWYGPELGVVIVAMANALTFLTLVWIGAWSVQAAERRQARAQKEVQERFQEVADAMPQIVWAAGADRQLDYYNERWYEYTGEPANQLGTQSWQHLLPPEDLARVAQEWTAAAAAARGYEVEFRLRRGTDGEFRWFLGRALPTKDAQGAILRWIGTATDIHESKLLREQNVLLLDSERAARTEAERINRMKDEFLATLSHELRTPLNAMLGWTQVLRGDPANSEDMEQGLATIERNARAQKGIIEDLLDMSSIISGKVRLDVQRVDLAAVLKAALETVRPAAEAKGIRLQPAIDPKARQISGDPNRLQQVFWNLLTNAVKFTPKGGRVQVTLERIHSHLEVNVIDSGEGISPEFLPNVFDRFRQADASTTRRHGGLGLGLAIVKQLVELHGGGVHVGSMGLGKGTTFRVMLPLVAVQPAEDFPDGDRRHPQAAGESPATPAKALQLTEVRVLVVDDEADARALVKRLLEDRGARVQTAGSVAEAMELLRAETPDVLVSDIGMPGEDGYSLIRQVRALGPELGGNVPAVALTAYARAEDRMKAVLAGFQMHVSKPVEPAELLAMVASLAGRTHRG